MAAYYGLCSWLDHNVGKIVDALEAAGALDNTRIIYTADHGDNIGARGLWGKSNLYQEAARVPMIDTGSTAGKVCDTPVSLLDISATISQHFASEIVGNDGLLPLNEIAAQDYDPERVVFSEYHAAGAVSGAFMVRKGRWKLISYIGFEDELFDLKNDPEETKNVAQQAEYADVIQDELKNEALKSAAWLKQQGVTTQTRVALMCDDPITFCRCWLGLAMLGATMVAINTSVRGEPLRHQLALAEVSHVIADPAHMETVRAGCGEAKVYSGNEVNDSIVEPLAESAVHPAKHSDLSCIMFTCWERWRHLLWRSLKLIAIVNISYKS